MANFDKKWSDLSGDESRAMKEKYGSRSAWQEAKKKAQTHQSQSQSQSGQRETKIDKPKADGTGGLYTDKKWSELTDKEKKEIKEIHAQGPDGPFKGAKDSWQDQRAKSMGFDSEQDKKDTWTEMRQEAVSRANNHQSQPSADPEPTPAPTATQTTPTPSSTESTTSSPTPEPTNTSDTNAPLPRISTQMEGYATDRKYTGPDGKMYTAKEADDAGWTAGYYDYGGGAYVPQQEVFEDPNSPEAVAYRQQYAKDTSPDGKYAEGMKYVSKDDPRRMYDASANVGYDQDLTPGQGLKQWHMGKAYKQEMEDQGIDWNAAGGYHNYEFDMTKGYFVPNQSLRQQRAQMWDNMSMRESDRGKLGDRHSYIHQYFDPLNGTFEYDNTYDMQ